ncbi:MAG: hypothetical protein JNM57_11085 [Cyclobacteriaceae bacterium]|nr:hypothetical protein [Cyclobacteriaceae bacterium]
MKEATTKNFLVITGLFLFVIHLSGCIFYYFSSPPTSSGLVRKVYSGIFLLGPFFNEDRIKASAHLYILSRRNEQWSAPVDYGSKNFQQYTTNPLRYKALKFSDFERYTARKVSQALQKENFDIVSTSSVFRSLNGFIQDIYFEGDSPDSIRLIYVVKAYNSGSKAYALDTAFNVCYHPHGITR